MGNFLTHKQYIFSEKEACNSTGEGIRAI